MPSSYSYTPHSHGWSSLSIWGNAAQRSTCPAPLCVVHLSVLRLRKKAQHSITRWQSVEPWRWLILSDGDKLNPSIMQLYFLFSFFFFRWKVFLKGNPASVLVLMPSSIFLCFFSRSQEWAGDAGEAAGRHSEDVRALLVFKWLLHLKAKHMSPKGFPREEDDQLSQTGGWRRGPFMFSLLASFCDVIAGK